MLCAHLMIGTNDRSFEERPNALHAVCMNIAAHPLFQAMINGLMLCIFIRYSFISRTLVGHDPFSCWIGGFFDKRMQGFFSSFLAAFLDPQPDLTAPLKSTEDHRLVFDVPTTNVSTPTPDICLVAFDSPFKKIWISFKHRFANSMTEVPSSLVAHRKRA